MKRLTMHARQILRRPQVTVCLGLLVGICGVSEILEEIIEGYEGTLQAAHGVLAFGVMTALKGLTELAEGVKIVSFEVEEIEREDEAGA